MSGLLVVGSRTSPRRRSCSAPRIAVLRRKSYIEAAIALGLPPSRVILKHVLWLHGRGLVLIQASIGMGEAILIETSLSYLGFGVQEPRPSWGNFAMYSAVCFVFALVLPRIAGRWAARPRTPCACWPGRRGCSRSP